MIAVALVTVVVVAALVAVRLAAPVAIGGGARDRRLATGIGWGLVAVGAGLSVVPWYGTEPPLRTAESALASVAFGALVAGPGVLALVGVRTGRPGMLLPAAIALVPLSFLSFALVTLPLLVPSVLLFRLSVRTTPDGRWTRALAAGLVGAGQLLVALGCFVALRTDRSYTLADGSGGGSTTGWVPWTTSALVLTLVATTIATTHAAAGGQPRR